MQRLRAVNVVDTGLASGPVNHALDRHLLALAAARRIHDTLRFYRSEPAVSVGCHQALAREVRLAYCRARGIDVVRRASGGGVLYLDRDQLAFSLVMRGTQRWRHAPLVELLQQGAAAVATGLQMLGIPARVKLPNDAEVDGRKIASVFVARDEHALLLQATVLLDADVRTMLEALRIPTEKLSANGLAVARERLTTAVACLGRAPQLAAVQSALMRGVELALGLRLRRRQSMPAPWSVGPEQLDAERDNAARIEWDDGDGESLEALIRTPGATLRARAAFTALGERLRRIEFATDAHIAPSGFFADLQDVLSGLPFPLAAGAIRHLMRRHAVQAVGVAGADIAQLLRQLADRHALMQRHRFSTREVNALMTCAAGAAPDTPGVLARASVMLVPYCAKPAWCKWRHRDGCGECGECEVGDAYRLARERNMRVTTILDYEHLVATLTEMKVRRVAAYVGMCCSNFFVKRHRAFAEAGIQAVLMEVSGANCYELEQEEQAYAGTFQAQSRLDRALLERVASLIPTAGARAAGVAKED